jgi:hypothetical protein
MNIVTDALSQPCWSCKDLPAEAVYSGFRALHSVLLLGGVQWVVGRCLFW